MTEAESFLLGTVGIDVDRALYLTPAEISHISEGYSRKERIRLVTTAQAFGSEISEREARRIIQGRPATASPEEQQKKLDQIKERLGR